MTAPLLSKFQRDLARGQEIERQLDEYLEPEYKIRPATRDEQRRGIDRFLTHRDTGETFAIDYKADFWAARTGRAFIETTSVDPGESINGQHKAGWALTSHADFIFYFVVGKRRLYVLSLAEIRAALPHWRLVCEPMRISNDGYQTEGLLVELRDLERIAESVVEVGA